MPGDERPAARPTSEPGDRRRSPGLHPLRPLRPGLRRHPVRTRSSAARARATRPASPSISTTRWATRPASPAASASPPARPGRSRTSRSRCRSSAPRADSRWTASARTAASAARSPTTSTASQQDRLGRGPRRQPGNQGRLCVKGRYGWDYARTTQRLTKPLIRREESYPKGALSDEVRGDSDGTGASASRAASSTTTRCMPALPRGDLGRGARPGRLPAAGDQGAARPGSAGRLRLGQVLATRRHTCSRS